MPNPWTTYPRRSIMQPSGFMLPINFSVFAGKQCTAFGGFEFDLNPIASVSIL